MPRVSQEPTRRKKQKSKPGKRKKLELSLPVIFIPGNVPSSKNSRPIYGKYLGKSKAWTKWSKESEAPMCIFKDIFLSVTEDLEKPYKIGFKFVRKSRHKFDYINPAQTIQDAMVKHGWIDDDNADEILPVFLPYEYNKEDRSQTINR